MAIGTIDGIFYDTEEEYNAAKTALGAWTPLGSIGNTKIRQYVGYVGGVHFQHMN